MAGFARTKRVTAPFDDEVKARIVGKPGCEPVYVSSGSEHDEDSPCLSDLIHGFLEDDDGEVETSPECKSDSERYPSSKPVDRSEDLLSPGFMAKDSFANVLLGKVSKATAVFSRMRYDKPIFQRNVMSFLRELGYNAAICKTRWESSGGLTAGNYEFIDVVVQSDSAASPSRRYFIDLDFAGEFEIARPTHGYDLLVQSLPRVFVGRGEELKRTVKLMSDAAKRSLKSRGLSLPPWRKNRYMQNKWFGPCLRTANVTPANSPSIPTPATKPGSTVKCRSVGFDAVKGPLYFPATARTR